jgi:hypothetical protein
MSEHRILNNRILFTQHIPALLIGSYKLLAVTVYGFIRSGAFRNVVERVPINQ